ncbi:MAG: cell wall hydrolase [Thermoplasmata archaeon]
MSWIDQNLIFLNLKPEELIALTAYGEAKNEGGEGLMAVINVIKNRVYDMQFVDKEIYNLTGSLWHAVILKPYQFSMYNIGDPVRKMAEKIASNFSYYLSTDDILKKAYILAQMAISGQLEDNTGGATHYHADYVYPNWAKVFDRTVQIGRHIFYSIYPEWMRKPVVVLGYEVKPVNLVLFIGVLVLMGFSIAKKLKTGGSYG